MNAHYEKLRSLLEEKGTTVDFDRLVKLGCDATELATRLIMLMSMRGSGIRYTTEYFFGCDRKRLQRAVRQVEKSASLLVKFNAKPAVAILRRTGSRFVDAPTVLVEYAQILRGALKTLKRRRRLDVDMNTMAIVVYVEDLTGQPHDPEVAALVGTVLGKEYGAEAHRAWRLKHRVEADFIRRFESFPEN